MPAAWKVEPHALRNGRPHHACWQSHRLNCIISADEFWMLQTPRHPRRLPPLQSKTSQQGKIWKDCKVEIANSWPIEIICISVANSFFWYSNFNTETVSRPKYISKLRGSRPVEGCHNDTNATSWYCILLKLENIFSERKKEWFWHTNNNFALPRLPCSRPNEGRLEPCDRCHDLGVWFPHG